MELGFCGTLCINVVLWDFWHPQTHQKNASSVFPLLGRPKSKCGGESSWHNNLISLSYYVKNKCRLCFFTSSNAIKWQLNKFWCEWIFGVSESANTENEKRKCVGYLLHALWDVGSAPLSFLRFTIVCNGILWSHHHHMLHNGWVWRDWGSRCSSN